MKDYDNALRIFSKVISDYPASSLASLAQCAIATIYQQGIKDLDTAKKEYWGLIKTYPNSVDAIRAKEMLTAIR